MATSETAVGCWRYIILFIRSYEIALLPSKHSRKTTSLLEPWASFFGQYTICWSNDANECVDSHHHSPFIPCCNVDLGSDFVLSLEHLIDFGQVIGPLGYSLGIALGCVTFLQMCLFSKHAHLPHRQQRPTHAPNDIWLTSSYVSGGTVLLASNLSCRLSCLTMGPMSPTTFMLKKELARPLP